MLIQVYKMKKFAVALGFILSSNTVLAGGSVCIDQTGKKVFSDIACEKRGLQVAKSDFPIELKDAVQPVFVVTNPEESTHLSKDDFKSKATTKTEKRASPWSSDIPLTGIAWLLISLMPIAAVFFLGFHLLMFIKARLRKYRHVRSSMGKAD